ncbi:MULTISPECIES: LLM class flavin-dependent oxidoreductase [unclassified Mycolicibacterium]|uniref:LLM class flavin-dependent oxidoreductase n=1 Tax=unclassified Mycolicibacterium TaxID=2636767 RepID=UPI00130BA36A|nr:MULTISPECIES: LLM class flavin-dependent oxidoreductase [unclassified Mycolicibacterium]MUL84688.1 LLM class flavin-dependent oxidoreductase [Mycolicibacterium sp. CBMA 329]MUL88463.1 LLM class flavin-dependent oxidoreductase [Mycolicibacterium sp. CBMA 331]MUM00198.1 LLM class flavin-dependent oxidoreductase [Mycolicibacterium sp. CBMA 334]MUM40110.1 LLM class flavin-dependent oxidoreductase [Mycolicibacterium sp. CBMA 247]MUM44528.1 LLM class flavin-dependent oxidoreductase [Mycolicibacte
MTRQIVLNAFDMNCVAHIVAGTWRHPESQAVRYKDIDYWLDLAKVLERGLFDGLFIADVLGIYDVYGGGPAAALRSGAQVPVNDPLLVVPAMATVTKNLGFGVTAATSFEHPYSFARRMSTLDHLTKGRAGWNIVTGYLESAAQNHGLETITPHADRYDIADEYTEVLYKLWEGSWEDDAVGVAPDRASYADPAKVHPIDHEGKHFRVPGIHLCEPSPQRTPVLYQAGASNRGRQFGAENAEVIFIGAPTKEILREAVADIRARAAAAGRDPYDVKIVNGHVVVTGATEQAAQARYDEFRRYTDPEGALALWSGWLGTDLSRFDLDDPVAVTDNEFLKSSVEMFGQGQWTLRDFIDAKAIDAEGGFTVGSPTQVADELQEWVEETDVDGFNLTNVITPGSFVDFVDHVVPELQRRGLYKTSYEEGTLRNKLFGRGPRLPESHRAARYRHANQEAIR